MKKQFFFGVVGVVAFLLVTNNAFAAVNPRILGEFEKYYQGTVTEIGNGVVTLSTSNPRIIDEQKQLTNQDRASAQGVQQKKTDRKKSGNKIKTGKQAIIAQGIANRIEKNQKQEARNQKLARKQSAEKPTATISVRVNPVLLKGMGLTKGQKIFVEGSYNGETNTLFATKIFNSAGKNLNQGR